MKIILQVAGTIILVLLVAFGVWRWIDSGKRADSIAIARALAAVWKCNISDEKIAEMVDEAHAQGHGNWEQSEQYVARYSDQSLFKICPR